MAGSSKWSQVKHIPGSLDAKRGVDAGRRIQDIITAVVRREERAPRVFAQPFVTRYNLGGQMIHAGWIHA